MNRTLKIVTLVTVLAGCSTQQASRPIPSKVLNHLSQEWVVVEACYNDDAYSALESANYREAIKYSLSTWSVNQEEADKTVNEQGAQLTTFKTNNNGLGTTCKDWKLDLEGMVLSSNKRKKQVEINQQRAYEYSNSTNNTSSNNNTVQCYRIGDVSFNKNIQTFKSGLCPVGWLKYSGY